VQRQDYGEQPYWMAIVLAALSGYLGKPGGGFGAGYGAEQAVGNITRRIRIKGPILLQNSFPWRGLPIYWPRPGNPSITTGSADGTPTFVSSTGAVAIRFIITKI